MPVTPHELEQFHDYVQARLGRPQPPESLQECLNQWQQDQEDARVVDDLQQAMIQIDSGTGISLDDATSQLREELSWYGHANEHADRDGSLGTPAVAGNSRLVS